MVHSRRFLRAAIVATLAALMSCTADSTSGVQSFVNGIVVSLTATNLKVGQSVQAIARDAYGATLTAIGPRWTSSNSSVVTVSRGGLVTAVAPGTADITGDIDGHKASATITVQAVAAAVSVSFATSARVGQTVAATASAVDVAGAALSDRVFTWGSSNVNVATISPTGTLTAVSPGTTTITATTDSVTGTATFTVVAPQAAAIAVTLGAARLTAGRTTPAAAAVEDSAGNVIPDRTITWSTSDASVATVSSIGEVHAVSPGNALVTAVSDGVVGTASLTVTGIPTALLVTTQPASTAPSGAVLALQPVVELRDASNRPVLLPGVAVNVAIATGHGTLSGSPTALTDAQGIARFTELSIAGSDLFTLSFTTPDVASATSSIISVGATPGGTGSASSADPTQLTISVQPSSTAHSGAAFAQQPAVQLRDGAGNVVSQAGVVITAALAGGGGALGGTTTATTNAAGVAIFSNLSISGAAGPRTLAFASLELASATSTPITIDAGSAIKLAVVTQPSASATSGTAFARQPAVQIRDAASNAVSRSGLVVTATIASGSGGTLGGSITATTDGNGVASFTNLQISGAGAFTLAFAAPGMNGVGSSAISVSAGSSGGASATATKLGITAQPSTEVSGAVLTQQPVIQLRDESNNAVSQAGVVVTASIASGGGTLGGTTVATTNASGVATFRNLSITGTVGSRTLSFSSGSLTAATSTVNITAGAASKLVVSNISSQTVGTPFDVTVTLADASNNPVNNTGASGSVTLARQVGTGTLGGTTSGTIPVGMSSVVISGVTYSVAEAGVVLTATGAGANSYVADRTGVSNAFVTSAAASSPSSPSSPTTSPDTSAPSGSSGTPVLLEDFSSYSSSSNLLANPRGIWATVEAKNTNRIVLDQTVGYGSSTQSMRYDWPNNGAQCLDYAIKPGMLKIPGNLKHVWIEFVVRFSTNFSVNAGASGCASEYKLASLGDYAHGVGRWDIAEMQAGQFNADAPGGPFTIVTTPKPSTLWDGQPHVFRAEAQLGNGNGMLRMWIDGQLVVNQTGLTTNSTQQVIDIFGPGLNINQGPGVAGMQMWWHKIAVYSSNPGWN